MVPRWVIQAFYFVGYLCLGIAAMAAILSVVDARP